MLTTLCPTSFLEESIHAIRVRRVLAVVTAVTGAGVTAATVASQAVTARNRFSAQKSGDDLWCGRLREKASSASSSWSTRD